MILEFEADTDDILTWRKYSMMICGQFSNKPFDFSTGNPFTPKNSISLKYDSIGAFNYYTMKKFSKCKTSDHWHFLFSQRYDNYTISPHISSCHFDNAFRNTRNYFHSERFSIFMSTIWNIYNDLWILSPSHLIFRHIHILPVLSSHAWM